MNSELFLKVSQREEGVDRIKAFLVFPVAVFYLAIMSGCVRTDQFMLDTQLGGGFLKRVWISRLLLEKRLVNSKPLSIWTYSARIPLRAYHFTSRFKKSAEE